MKALKYIDQYGQTQFINMNYIERIVAGTDEHGRPYLNVCFPSSAHRPGGSYITLYHHNKPEIVNHHEFEALLYDWYESSE